ncbi:MAG: GIY-YIG nuclease family protein [Hyphomicrobiales bacterium]|nr:GIY-YIG nuclease family protein [Hyphomicrobiales bacterium]
MERSWREAIKKVLTEAGTSLPYQEISERILSGGHYETDGATPAATVNATLTTSIKNDGDKSPFVRVGKGIFGLKNLPQTTDFIPSNVNKEDNKLETLADSDVESSAAIISSFGMYWQRDLVVWRNDPKMYGKQQAKSKAVDFGRQKGIYILYDHHDVIYVGRIIDRPLGRRLFEHTIDRLGGRWNRFSWFGLLEVTEAGDLREVTFNTSLASIIATLESLLIEALEPPQNRKRGDDFSAAEYIQDIDPELNEIKLKQTLRDIENKIRMTDSN